MSFKLQCFLFKIRFKILKFKIIKFYSLNNNNLRHFHNIKLVQMLSSKINQLLHKTHYKLIKEEDAQCKLKKHTHKKKTNWVKSEKLVIMQMHNSFAKRAAGFIQLQRITQCQNCKLLQLSVCVCVCLCLTMSVCAHVSCAYA